MCEYSEWFYDFFYEQYQQLILRLDVIAQQHPESYHTTEYARFFRRLRDRMDDALFDPEKKEYHLGDTSVQGLDAWRRIKDGMPERNRLFFQFSAQDRQVVFAWLTDALRRKGDHNDVYQVFQRMIKRNNIPNNIADLCARAKQYDKNSESN
jgi:toxin YhaV